MTVTLSPLGGAAQQFFNNNGIPLAGGKIYTYAAGTTTPKATYTSSTGVTAHSNPIILDSSGRVPGGQIWLTSNDVYKFVIYTSVDVLIGSYDNIAASNDPNAVWFKGDYVAVASTQAAVDWYRSPAITPYPPEYNGVLWTDKVYYYHAITTDFNAANSPVNTPLSSPAVTLQLASNNTGSDAIVLPLQTISGVHVNGKEGTGGNFITYCDSNLTNVKLKGLEIDIQPGAGSTIADSFGLAINAFTMLVPGPAIYIEGVFGGKFGTGLSVGNLSDLGSGVGPAAGNPRMGTLIDSGVAQYQIDAIKLSTNHKVRFDGAGGNKSQIYIDSSNFWKFVLAGNSLAFRDPTDTSTLVAIGLNGNISLEAGGTLEFTLAQSTPTAVAGVNTLPSNPVGFLTVKIDGTARKIPYYQ